MKKTKIKNTEKYSGDNFPELWVLQNLIAWTGNASMALRACRVYTQGDTVWSSSDKWYTLMCTCTSFLLVLSLNASLCPLGQQEPQSSGTTWISFMCIYHKSISSDLLYVSHILFCWSVKSSEHVEVCIQKVSTHEPKFCSETFSLNIFQGYAISCLSDLSKQET